MKKNKYHNQIIKLMQKMTLQEKIGQLSQSFYYSDVITGPLFDCSDTVSRIKNGDVGSMLNVISPKMAYNLQQVAVNQTRLHIPLMFMLDVIHGYKTMYPTPLSMSCSFDEKLIERICKNVAYETYHSSINVTFSPMLDYVNDARWGRVNESNGEDVLLSARLAKAYVKGYQYNKRLGACAKHFVGYGACEAGKDYYRTIISEIDLYQNYLEPFKEAFKNNVLGVMIAFSSLNGKAMLTNKKYTYDLIRKKYHYDGFSITDYGSLAELINYKVAEDEKEAALKAITSSIDIEMATTCYSKNLYDLALNDKKIIKFINESCYRVLLAKYKLGLFDNPYRNIYLKPEKYYQLDRFVKDAYEIASKSLLMLKNDNILPISNHKKIAIVGPYSNTKDLNGPWACQSTNNNIKTLYEKLKEYQNIEIIDKYSDLDNASLADVVLFCAGETNGMYGESFSRVNLSLPIDQEMFLNELYKINPNIIMIIFAGRPLALTNYVDKVKAILYSFFLGQETSNAIIDIIMGKISPSAKASISFPRSVGQCPITYQTYHVGRENLDCSSNNIFKLRYIDEKLDPLYFFSEGLSYNTYKYFDFKISNNVLESKKDYIDISFKIKNEGKYESDEIVFMFIESLHSDIIRPYNELKDYKKIHLLSNQTKEVSFKINYQTLQHINQNLVKYADYGKYLIKIGTNIKSLKVFEIVYQKNKY